jgi:hypothetical protein
LGLRHRGVPCPRLCGIVDDEAFLDACPASPHAIRSRYLIENHVDRFESKSFDRECIKFFDLDLHLTVLTIPHSIKRFNQPLDDAVYHESLIAENAEPTIYTPHD